MRESWPQDKLIAVALLLAAMTPDAKAAITRIKREDLFPDHTGMTDFVRQNFGLWNGNIALIKSCACSAPDGAAMAIIELAWKALCAGGEARVMT